jgi:hypothetical protein
MEGGPSNSLRQGNMTEKRGFITTGQDIMIRRQGGLLQGIRSRLPEGDVNLYAYVGNNPVNWADPDGLATKPGECPN